MNFTLTIVAAAVRHVCQGKPERFMAPGKAVALAVRYGDLGAWLWQQRFVSGG